MKILKRKGGGSVKFYSQNFFRYTSRCKEVSGLILRLIPEGWECIIISIPANVSKLYHMVTGQLLVNIRWFFIQGCAPSMWFSYFEDFYVLLTSLSHICLNLDETSFRVMSQKLKARLGRCVIQVIKNMIEVRTINLTFRTIV